jgi:hypothetical protein
MRRSFLAISGALLIGAFTVTALAYHQGEWCHDDNSCILMTGGGCYPTPDAFGGTQYASGGQGEVIQSCQADYEHWSGGCWRDAPKSQLCRSQAQVFTAPGCDPADASGVEDTYVNSCYD